ncbi:MAG: hypothetical protein C0478_14730 [Planctomyces sp.]|nr:hypothetical protein [Planctomyces sp.]
MRVFPSEKLPNEAHFLPLKWVASTDGEWISRKKPSLVGLFERKGWRKFQRLMECTRPQTFAIGSWDQRFRIPQPYRADWQLMA